MALSQLCIHIHPCNTNIKALTEVASTQSSIAANMAVAAPLVNGCYFTNWATYRAEPNKFTPETVPVGLCTHIFYAFAAVNVATFEARMTDTWADEGLGGMQKINDIKKKQPGLKTILSFGGWTESESGIYSTVASDPAKRSKFVKSAWALANRFGFDGIDLDWEYPNAANKENFVNIIKELKTQSGGKLVTAAVSAGKTTIDAGYDVPKFAQYLDYLNVMSYDFHGFAETSIGHQAAYSETAGALAHWASKGMPKNKILMGIGAYGRGWFANTCAHGAAGSGPASALPVTQTDGMAAYFELAKMGGKTIQSPEGPYLEVTLNGRKACYGFDDKDAILKKMALVKAQGYGGAFTWAMDFDTKEFPLHKAIKQGLSGATVPAPAPSPSATTKKVPAPAPAPATTTKKSPVPAPAPVPAPSGKCTSGDMRANASPSKYEQCVNGSWVVRDCPPGTVYDPATKNFKVGK